MRNGRRSAVLSAQTGADGGIPGEEVPGAARGRALQPEAGLQLQTGRAADEAPADAHLLREREHPVEILRVLQRQALQRGTVCPAQIAPQTEQAV